MAAQKRSFEDAGLQTTQLESKKSKIDEDMVVDSCEEDVDENLVHVPPKTLSIRRPIRIMNGRDNEGPFGTNRRGFWSQRYGTYTIGDPQGYNLRVKRYRKKNGHHQVYCQVNTVIDNVHKANWFVLNADGLREFAIVLNEVMTEIDGYETKV